MWDVQGEDEMWEVTALNPEHCLSINFAASRSSAATFTVLLVAPI